MDRPAGPDVSRRRGVSPVAVDAVADPSPKSLTGLSGSSLDDDPYREDGGEG
jgi:hypothetical protein